MARTKLCCNATVGELRQDDGLLCGTKVVPIAAAINPLVIIKRKGPHRQSSILLQVERYETVTTMLADTPLDSSVAVFREDHAPDGAHQMPRLSQMPKVLLSFIRVLQVCQEKNASSPLAAATGSGHRIGAAGHPF